MTSLNAYMHPRNIYKTALNFEELIASFPELSEYIHRKPNGKIVFHFNDREGLRCLSTVLLKKDFYLEVKIPKNTLIPTLPLRLNYILWIEDLVHKFGLESSITGVDIGTGATCVYPLLLARRNKWKMIGTDIDDSVIQTARENVQRNQLQDLISVIKVSSLLDLLSSQSERFDFCMCNPPFFKKDEDEFELPSKKNRASRRMRSKSHISGTSNEISSPGGEEEFIRNIMKDSLLLRDRINVYTTMIGCKATLRPVLNLLKENSIESFCETQFCQGRTMRWAVAWTFTSVRLMSSAPSFPFKTKRLKTASWNLLSKYKFKECIGQINELLNQLQIKHHISERRKRKVKWYITAYHKTWVGLRKTRREQQRKQISEEDVSSIKLSGNLMVTDKSTFQLNDPFLNGSKRKGSSKLCDEMDFCHKKMKLESSPAILEAELCIEKIENNKIENNFTLYIKYNAGEKEAPQQILQFFKNKLM